MSSSSSLTKTYAEGQLFRVITARGHYTYYRQHNGRREKIPNPILDKLKQSNPQWRDLIKCGLNAQGNLVYWYKSPDTGKNKPLKAPALGEPCVTTDHRRRDDDDADAGSRGRGRGGGGGRNDSAAETTRNRNDNENGRRDSTQSSSSSATTPRRRRGGGVAADVDDDADAPRVPGGRNSRVELERLMRQYYPNLNLSSMTQKNMKVLVQTAMSAAATTTGVGGGGKTSSRDSPPLPDTFFNVGRADDEEDNYYDDDNYDGHGRDDRAGHVRRPIRRDNDDDDADAAADGDRRGDVGGSGRNGSRRPRLRDDNDDDRQQQQPPSRRRDNDNDDGRQSRHRRDAREEVGDGRRDERSSVGGGGGSQPKPRTQDQDGRRRDDDDDDERDRRRPIPRDDGGGATNDDGSAAAAADWDRDWGRDIDPDDDDQREQFERCRPEVDERRRIDELGLKSAFFMPVDVTTTTARWVAPEFDDRRRMLILQIDLNDYSDRGRVIDLDDRDRDAAVIQIFIDRGELNCVSGCRRPRHPGSFVVSCRRNDRGDVRLVPLRKHLASEPSYPGVYELEELLGVRKLHPNIERRIQRVRERGWIQMGGSITLEGMARHHTVDEPIVPLVQWHMTDDQRKELEWDDLEKVAVHTDTDRGPLDLDRLQLYYK